MKPVFVLAAVLFASFILLGCVTSTPTPTVQATGSATATVSATSSPVPTATIGATPTPTDSATPSATATPSPTPGTVKLTAFASDGGFTPDTLSAPAGSKVELTVNVDGENTYYGGLDIKCQDLNFNSGRVPPGGSATLDFTLTQNVLCSAYWPSSGVKKGNLNIQAT